MVPDYFIKLYKVFTTSGLFQYLKRPMVAMFGDEQMSAGGAADVGFDLLLFL